MGNSQGVSQSVCQSARVRIGTRTSNQSQPKCRFVAHKQKTKKRDCRFACGSREPKAAGDWRSRWSRWNVTADEPYKIVIDCWAAFFGSLAGITTGCLRKGRQLNCGPPPPACKPVHFSLQLPAANLGCRRNVGIFPWSQMAASIWSSHILKGKKGLWTRGSFFIII